MPDTDLTDAERAEIVRQIELDTDEFDALIAEALLAGPNEELAKYIQEM